MKLLFLVPARGGSKRFPGKNLALLGGIPLVGRAARAGRLAAAAFPGSRVVCSTDDPAIAAAAREWGAETPFMRPSELATDEASSIDVLIHALDTLQDPFDAVVTLQPTSPLVEAADIRGAVDLFRATAAPVVSVCSAEHPVEWYHRMDADNRLIPILPADGGGLRDVTEPSYRPNGAVYITSPGHARGDGFWTPETRGFVMPVERSVDVDTVLDLDLARALARQPAAAVLDIAGRRIGPGHPCFVIAEAGVNHNGSLDLASRLVDAAAAAGADAVKFQTFRAEKIATLLAPKAEYQKRTTGASETQFEMLKKLELSPEDHRILAARCADRGLIFLSSPFDEDSADLLETLDVPAFKVPSGELTNLPFLRYLARKGRPLIISTGMATLAEVEAAVAAVTGAGCDALALLQCVSNYPASASDVNLRAMATMAAAFGVPVGYSDHSTGSEVSLAAVALGACIIEKHFTLDRSLPGPDHQASAEPAEFAALVSGIRTVEAALGDGDKRPADSERETSRVARRSLVAAETIPEGSRLTMEMVTARRPGTGLPADRIGELLGRKALGEVPAGTILTMEMFAP